MTDQAVIKKILESGDSSQYRTLVEKHHVGLINYMFGYTRDQGSAEDLAQEAFIKAYKNLHKYNPEYAFSTWLYKIATNLALSYLKKHRELPLDETLLPNLSDELGEQVDRESQAHAIRQCVAKLPENYQRVVQLYYWHGFTYEEVAETVGKPTGTVKTWLHRAKIMMKKELSYE